MINSTSLTMVIINMACLEIDIVCFIDYIGHALRIEDPSSRNRILRTQFLHLSESYRTCSDKIDILPSIKATLNVHNLSPDTYPMRVTKPPCSPKETKQMVAITR